LYSILTEIVLSRCNNGRPHEIAHQSFKNIFNGAKGTANPQCRCFRRAIRTAEYGIRPR